MIISQQIYSNKKMWESHHASHTVTIQWIHVVVDPLLPI